jgi:hypothetical protein
MKIIIIIAIAVVLSSIPFSATAADNAQYVYRYLPPFGPYFHLGSSFYRIKGVEEVDGLGSYGRITNNEFFFGVFKTNGYGPRGTIEGIAELETRLAESTSESIINAYGEGHVTENAGGTIDLEIKEDELYSVVLVRPKNLEVFFEKVMEKYNAGSATVKRNFQNANFRFIDALIYATDLKINTVTHIEGEISANGAISGVSIRGTLKGDADFDKTFNLPGKQIIAYSFTRLCWENKQIVSYQEDDPNPDNVSTCNEYE